MAVECCCDGDEYFLNTGIKSWSIFTSSVMEFQQYISSNESAGDTFNTTKSHSFPTESLSFKIFKLFCYSLVFVLGVVGNVLVFRMVVKRRKLRTVSNMFICNLAAADIAVLTVNLPFRLAYQENSYIWPFGSVLCKTIPMLTYLFITASSATLVLMTIDQYRAIVKPLRRRFTIKITKFAILLIWIFSALITLPFNFALRVVERQSDQPVCTDVWPSEQFERFYFSCLFVVQFVIPMTIIMSCYILICGHLNSRTGLDRLTCTSTKQRSDRNKKVRSRLAVQSDHKIAFIWCSLLWFWNDFIGKCWLYLFFDHYRPFPFIRIKYGSLMLEFISQRHRSIYQTMIYC